ncbi:hypothetical protein Tco_0822425 [Tanacetum coccineum]|uniref:Uncharacterized protein n=1 Tax=Tanacetum coccineum TaxID=301880 RepID=A0ABQ5AG39_9ASTR
MHLSLGPIIHYYSKILTPPLPILVPTSSPTFVGGSIAAAARPARGLRADYGFVAIMDREIRRDPERERLDMGSPTRGTR